MWPTQPQFSPPTGSRSGLQCWAAVLGSSGWIPCEQSAALLYLVGTRHGGRLISIFSTLRTERGEMWESVEKLTCEISGAICTGLGSCTITGARKRSPSINTGNRRKEDASRNQSAASIMH